MIDFNYFKNFHVILFIAVSTSFLISVLIYRRYHNVKFKSFTAILMLVFYFSVIFSGIYLTYYEVLAKYYYEHGLYKEASYNFMKDEEIKNSYYYKLLDILIFKDDKNLNRYKLISFYASKNYNKAIKYIKKEFSKNNPENIRIFLKLYLAHSYLETGNKSGKSLFFEAYLQAVCFLNKDELNFFESIVKLNTALKTLL